MVGTAVYAGVTGHGVEWVFYLAPLSHILSGGHVDEYNRIRDYAFRRGVAVAAGMAIGGFLWACVWLSVLGLPVYYLSAWLAR